MDTGSSQPKEISASTCRECLMLSVDPTHAIAYASYRPHEDFHPCPFHAPLPPTSPSLLEPEAFAQQLEDSSDEDSDEEITVVRAAPLPVSSPPRVSARRVLSFASPPREEQAARHVKRRAEEEQAARHVKRRAEEEQAARHVKRRAEEEVQEVKRLLTQANNRIVALGDELKNAQDMLEDVETCVADFGKDLLVDTLGNKNGRLLRRIDSFIERHRLATIIFNCEENVQNIVAESKDIYRRRFPGAPEEDVSGIDDLMIEVNSYVLPETRAEADIDRATCVRRLLSKTRRARLAREARASSRPDGEARASSRPDGEARA